MKKFTILAITLFVPIFLFCQKPFSPIGAKSGGIIQCSDTFWPCPPDYPIYHAFEVTEDTTIQGKYCTLIEDRDWSWEFDNERIIVHQDSHLIYRYDRKDETFKLVLDFSKEVGESWQIEVPEEWAGVDTFTITVTQKSGDSRLVSVSAGNWEIFTDLPLFEGYGGIVHNKRLLFGFEFFIIVDPIIWDELTCYIDPVEGLLFGTATGCNPTSTTSLKIEKTEFVVFPIPANVDIEITCKHPISSAAEWNLFDAFGRKIKSQGLAPHAENQSMSVSDLAPGIYYWNVHTGGETIGAGKVIVARQ